MIHRHRLVALGVSTLGFGALFVGCGDYGDTDKMGTEVITGDPTDAPSTPMPTATQPVSTSMPTVDPQPTAPAPTATMPPPAPDPTEPASTEPASTEPASTEPASTEPASTEPASTDPEPVEPPQEVEASCESIEPCGGDVVGTWTVVGSCLPVSGATNMMGFGLGCAEAPTTGELAVSGTWTLNEDGTIMDATTTTGDQEISLPYSCLDVSGTVTTCDRVGAPLQALGFESVTCTDNVETMGCDCPAVVDQMGGAAYISLSPLKNAMYTIADGVITVTNLRVETPYSYCVEGDTLTLSPAAPNKTGPVAGTIVLKKM